MDIYHNIYCIILTKILLIYGTVLEIFHFKIYCVVLNSLRFYKNSKTLLILGLESNPEVQLHMYFVSIYSLLCHQRILLVGRGCLSRYFNTLNAELNPICHFLALLGAHPILHISRTRVNDVCYCNL
jgi:hypothetical protein